MTQMWNKMKTWWNGAPPADVDAELAKVREQAPAPVFWLLGKTQSGKSSVVRALTNADDAEIGSGFRPCTKTSRRFPFPTPEAPVLEFLDTRGLGEPGYDSSEDVAAFQTVAHLVLVTCRITDFATADLRTQLGTIRTANPNRPVVLLLTCLHEAYPQQQHPPYPDTADGFSEEVKTLVERQKQDFAGLFDDLVLVDFTKPVEGYTEPNYGLDALQAKLLILLPGAYKETLRNLTDAQTQFRDRRYQQAVPVLVGYSTLAATAGAFPIPFVDLLMLPAIQTKMIHALAQRSGNPQASTRFLELSASAGLGLLATVALRQVAKLIPYVGSVVGAGLAGGSTYALGRAFLEYDRRVHDGHLPSQDDVAEMYKEHLKQSESRWKIGRS
jgi:uncharacterized protein (DUF697 family)/predicted GTPase